MNCTSVKILAAAILTCIATEAGAQDPVSAPYLPDSGNLSIRCGILVDGIADQPYTFRTVEIVDGRIASIGYSEEDVDLDLSAYTCMPGFIDTHTHIADTLSGADLSEYYSLSDEELVRVSRENAELTIAAGVTTARNVGAYVGWSGRDLRDRINRGEIAGPRMQIAGYYLTIPGGGGDLVIPGHEESEIPARLRMGVARGPEAFRRKAQEAVDGGADVLKIIASGAVLAYGGVPGAPEMTPEEIRAVVEVAHAAGIKVTAHAHGAQSIKDAILAGVDSIEHASLADDEAIALAAQRGVAFSMDIYNGDYIATVGREQGWPEEFIRKGDETTELQRQVFSRAVEAGVIVTFGTDAGVYPHGDAARQFPIMVQRGMTPMQAIKAATSVAARVIGWEKDVGSLEVGRYGDLIAVQGDPLSNVSLLQEVRVVVKGGLVFKNDASR
ncbi:MAG: amidohydrolase family protein [Woeseiaceae bacterium]|nr:amidohydrolase family protein [Woeseiaceae bacterium]